MGSGIKKVGRDCNIEIFEVVFVGKWLSNRNIFER
jgi:hypothetical protein